MKQVIRISVLMLLLAACKSTNKVVTDEVGALKKIPARKVIKNHRENSFQAKTMDARLKVVFSENRKNKRSKRQSLSVRLRIKKDSIIWIKGSKVVSAFRAKITPNTFSYYSPISKEYFTGDYQYLERLLGVKITFDQLQNLLFGQSIWDLKDRRFTSSVEQKAYKLTPKTQEELYSIFFYFHPSNFRIKRQLLMDKDNKMLTIQYPGYILKEDEYFPKKIEINATEKDYYTFIAIDVRTFEVNKPITTPYRIPAGYKELVVKK